MKRNGKQFSPKVKGGRTVTVTLRTTPQDAAHIDQIAAKNGLCRAYFIMKCANAGYTALRETGEMQ